jgi:nicotinamide mononucleotide (NMN) deamidase PncC
VFGIVTGGLALAEQIPAAGVTAITGAGFITYSSQMNKDAQEKLEDLLKRLQERKG